MEGFSGYPEEQRRRAQKVKVDAGIWGFGKLC